MRGQKLERRQMFLSRFNCCGFQGKVLKLYLQGLRDVKHYT